MPPVRPKSDLDTTSLRPTMLNKIRSRKDNHKTLIENIHMAMDAVGESAACVEKHAGSELPAGAVDKLKECLLLLAKAEYEVEDYCNVLERAGQLYGDPRHEGTGIAQLLDDGYAQLRSSAVARDPAKHRTVVEAFQKIWKVNHTGPMPGSAPRDDDDVEEADVGGLSSVYVNVKCPISFKDIVSLTRPFRGKECGHLFEEEAISQLLRRQASMLCPIVGCRTKLALNGIELARDVARENKKNGYRAAPMPSQQAREQVAVEDV